MNLFSEISLVGENVALIKHRNQTYEQNQCRGEPYVRPLTESEIKPMSDGDGAHSKKVGHSLMIIEK